jgi:serine/threonine protein kinase
MFRPIQFGKYYLTDRLAVGGMAEIYKATLYGVSGFEKPMVVKQILPQYARNAEFIKMFIDEAKIAVSLSHGNIIPVYELGRIDGVYFIAMEFVSGKNLAQIMEEAHTRDLPLSVEHAIFIAIEMSKGLDYAHRRADDQGEPLGVVHRDISPSNVLVTMAGEVKIADFGIAKATDKLGVTEAGVVKGSYGYMSPEQIQGLEVDHRTDIFSSGILLHEMVTGRRLFEGSDAAMVERIKEAIVTLPSVISPRAPVELDPVILQALAKDPKDRFQDANEFQLALSRILFSIGAGATSATLAQYMRQLFPPSKTPRSEEVVVDAKPPDVQVDEPNTDFDGTQSYAVREELETLAPARSAVKLRQVDAAPLAPRKENSGTLALPAAPEPEALEQDLELPDVPELHEKARAQPANHSDEFAAALVAAHDSRDAEGRDRVRTKVERPNRAAPVDFDAAESLSHEADLLAGADEDQPTAEIKTNKTNAPKPQDAKPGKGNGKPAGEANVAEKAATATGSSDSKAGLAGAPYIVPKKRGPRSDASVMALLVSPNEKSQPQPDISLLDPADAVEHPGDNMFAAHNAAVAAKAAEEPPKSSLDSVADASGSAPLPKRDSSLVDVPTGEIPRHRKPSGVFQSTMQLFVQGIEEEELEDPSLLAEQAPAKTVKPTLLGWVVVLLLVAAAAFFVIYKKTSLFKDRSPKSTDALLKADDIKKAKKAPPVVKKGNIELTVATEGALIYQHVGQTPIKLSLAKNQQIRAERSGYRTVNKTIDAAAVSAGQLSMALQPTGAQTKDAFPENIVSDFATSGVKKAINVKSEPPSATLWLLVGKQEVKLSNVDQRH